MKKDILFLCQFFYPEHNSSATLPFDTACYFARRGLTVDALVGVPKEYSDETGVPVREEKNGVGIRRLRYLHPARGKKGSRLINYFSFTFHALLHVGTLRHYRSVIVYSNPPILPLVPIAANALFGTKIVFVAYDVYPEVAFASASLRPGSFIDRGMRWINHQLFQRADAVVALTEEMKRFLLQNRPELAQTRVHMIPNWAHEKRICVTDAAYRRFGYCPGQFIVSYFGNMGTCQEMETLVRTIEQMADHPEVRFLLIGHGNKQEAIRNRFRRQQLDNVQMLDFLTGEAFEQAVAVSSCCVVSLERGLKGTCAPSKYYSYLQGGKPVLAVVEEGSYLEQEIAQFRIGAAVRIGDSEGLRRRILELASDPDALTQMSERASEIYERQYAYEISMEKYGTMMDEVLNS